MALSYNQYPGDGANRNFSVAFQYLSRSHVTATINGVNAPFTWLSPSLIQLNTVPPAGTLVEVRRTTPRQVSQVDFVDGSTLTERDLDTGVLQSFYLAQEAFDVAGATLSQTLDGQLAANGRRLTLLGDPVAPQDAVTKQWAETVGTGFAANAQSSANAAAASAASAASSASSANTSRVGTEAARDVTLTARDVALGARDVANTAANSANAERLAAQAAATAAAASKADAEARSNDAAMASVSANNSANLANTARLEAETWAEAGVNVPVEPGKFSAKHWATIAEAKAGTPSALGTAFTPTTEISATNVQLAIQEVYAEKAQLGHTHTIAETTGLQTALDGKAAAGHTHTTAQVSGLDTALAAKANLAGNNTFTGDQLLQKNQARIVLRRGDNAASEDNPGIDVQNAAGTVVSQFNYNHGLNVWRVGTNALWHAGNFTPGNYALLAGATFTGDVFFNSGNAVIRSDNNVHLWFRNLANVNNGLLYYERADGSLRGQLYNASGTFVRDFQFRQSDGRFYVNGYLETNGSVTGARVLASRNGHDFNDWGTAALEVRSSDGGNAIMSFHRSGHIVVQMGLRADGLFELGGGSWARDRFIVSSGGAIFGGAYGWLHDYFVTRGQAGTTGEFFSVAYLRNDHNAEIGPSGVVGGHVLAWSDAGNGQFPNGNGRPAGNWRCMGSCRPGYASVFVRVS